MPYSFIAAFFDIQTIEPNSPLLAFRVLLFKKLAYAAICIGCPRTPPLYSFPGTLFIATVHLAKYVEAGHILFKYLYFAHKNGFSKSLHRVG